MGEDPHPRKAAGAGLQGGFLGASPPVPRTGASPFPAPARPCGRRRRALPAQNRGSPSGRKVPPLHVQARRGRLFTAGHPGRY